MLADRAGARSMRRHLACTPPQSWSGGCRRRRSTCRPQSASRGRHADQCTAESATSVGGAPPRLGVPHHRRPARRRPQERRSPPSPPQVTSSTYGFNIVEVTRHPVREVTWPVGGYGEGVLLLLCAAYEAARDEPAINPPDPPKRSLGGCAWSALWSGEGKGGRWTSAHSVQARLTGVGTCLCGGVPGLADASVLHRRGRPRGRPRAQRKRRGAPSTAKGLAGPAVWRLHPARRCSCKASRSNRVRSGAW